MRSASVERLAALGAVLCLLAGCGGGGRVLEGSLAELLPLDYTRAEVAGGAVELTIRFLRPYGTGEDTVLKVAVATADAELTPRTPLDLGQELAGGGPRASVSRHVYEDPDHRTLPRVQRGQLILYKLPSPGGRVQGSLAVTFVQGSEFGSGRTVRGEFDAEVAP